MEPLKDNKKHDFLYYYGSVIQALIPPPSMHGISQLRHLQHGLGNSYRDADSVLKILIDLWELGTEQEQGYRTGPPGYTAWGNWFVGIDSWASLKFKNSGSMVAVVAARALQKPIES